MYLILIISLQVELEAHERRVDGFLSTLEATIGDLQVSLILVIHISSCTIALTLTTQKQKESILGKNHVVI